MKAEGMKALSEICKKDSTYVNVIKELSVVKNAVELLGGKRTLEAGRGRKGDKRKGKKEEKGKGVLGELTVREKIGLLDLLSGLVKRGLEMEDEEELKEVGMMLEEEGSKHVEEGEEGEEEERKKEQERIQWDELTEKARNFVWVMESAKARREGKKIQTLRMMKKMGGNTEKLEEAQSTIERLEEENAELKAELEQARKGKGGGRGRRRGARTEEEEEEAEGSSGEGGRMEAEEEKKKEPYQMNKMIEEIELLRQMLTPFADRRLLTFRNNSISHNLLPIPASLFIGPELADSVHRMFESFKSFSLMK